ncbi:uncharacterized protein LOC121428091 [Lytechinus variegatus]|uniref:uncharacterized protein LOC121428091 n=1 Tax=Lytechinus variegatus TaxID=7654 RepID=UPI001BB22303|nr:uncharacterized protein LOC121428091 [Lytechinus variegatus]
MYNLFHPATKSVVTTTIVSYANGSSASGADGSIYAVYDVHFNTSRTSLDVLTMLQEELIRSNYLLNADGNNNLYLSPRPQDAADVNAIDECLLGEDDCSANARCTDLNDAGGFSCACDPEYEDILPELPGRLCTLIVTNGTNSTDFTTTLPTNTVSPSSSASLDVTSGTNGTDSTTSAVSTTVSSSQTSSTSLETWQIVVISIGCLSAGLLLALCCCCLFLIPLRRRRYMNQKPEESMIYNYANHQMIEPAAFFARIYEGSLNETSDFPSVRTRSSRPFSESVVSNPIAVAEPLSSHDPLVYDVTERDYITESVRHYAVDPRETSIRESFKRVLNDVLARGPPDQRGPRARVPDHLAAFLEESRSSPINDGIINNTFDDVESPPQGRKPITPNMFFARMIDGSES